VSWSAGSAGGAEPRRLSPSDRLLAPVLQQVATSGRWTTGPPDIGAFAGADCAGSERRVE
jgi:hypothetical protein